MIAALLSLLIAFKSVSAAGKNWAVLIAGSRGWSNYRHQSDVCHAYQIVTKLGKIPPENVILMMVWLPLFCSDFSRKTFPSKMFPNQKKKSCSKISCENEFCLIF